MNRKFKTTWNHATKTWVAVSEIACGHGKNSNTSSLKNGLFIHFALAPVVFVGVLMAEPVLAGTVVDCGKAPDDSSIALGGKNCTYPAEAAGTSSIAIGASSYAGGSGTGTSATGNAAGNWNQVALGTNARAIGMAALSFGADSSTNGIGAIALGMKSQANANAAIAMGDSSNAAGTSALAFGALASASQDNSVAIGRSAQAIRAGSVALGNNSVADRSNTVSVGSASTQRQITYVAAGTLDTDAVNLSQLNAVAAGADQNTARIASALGGGATVGGDGLITTPTYTVDGTSVNSVGAALDNLEGRVTGNNNSIINLQGSVNNLTAQINSGELGLVQQDATSRTIAVAKDIDGNLVDFTGTTGARQLTGIAQGDVSQDSTDAVNGAQLFATNQSITDLDGRVIIAESSISNLESSVTDLTMQINDGELGLVQQAADKTIAVAKNKDGQLIDFSGTQGERVLAGVADGQINPFSTQAINGRQVFDISQSMAAAIGGGATVNGNGSITAPSYSVGNMTVNSVGSAISNLDTRVTMVESTINQFTDQVNQGEIGLVKQDQNSRDITIAADSDGTLVNIAGTDGERTLTGLADGEVNADSTDAVNGGQLYNVSQRITQMEQNLGNGIATDLDYIQTDGKRDGSDRASVTAGSNGAALGANASVSASNGTAIGANASAKAENSVALGANSVADRANSVSVGSAGHERVVAHVADPVEATDAVNKRTMDTAIAQNNQYFDQRIHRVEQAVNNVARKAYGGVAAATALTMIPDVDSGKRFAVGVGTSTFQGYGAAAVGVSMRLGANTKAKFGAGFSSAGSSVGGGVAFQW